MATFSKKSKALIDTLHPDLQRVLYEAIKIVDFTVLCGLRNKQDQNKAVSTGNSKLAYPNSKHNRSKCADGSYDYTISDAVDIVPYPVKWPNAKNQTTKEYTQRIGAFFMLAGVMLTVANKLNIKLRWGGNFKSFFDGPHFERIAE